MKKLLIILCLLIPALVVGQQYNVRTRISGNSVIFDRGGTPFVAGVTSVPTYFIAASNATAKEIRIADATCDGTADQVQINTALIAGYKVGLSTGQFNIAAPITASVDNITLEGSGKSTVINLSSGANSNVITQGGNYWAIKNLTINGNDAGNTGTCYGIYNIRKKGLTIENVEIFAVEDYAVSLKDSANTVNVKNSYIHDSGGAGIYGIRSGDYPGEIGKGPYDVNIDNCRFHNTGSGADVGCMNYSASTYKPYNWNVTNCKFTGYVGYMGIYYVDGHNLNAYNNYFELDSALGVSSPACIRYYNDANGGIVDGNTFRSTGYDGHATISIINSHNITVSNNNFTSTHIGSTHGIHIESYLMDAVAYNVYDINITGNNFYNVGNKSDARAIVLYSESPYTISRVNISGNIFMDDRGAGALTTSAIFVNSDGCNNINVTGNIAEGIREDFLRITGGSTASGIIIANNLIIDIPTGIIADKGDDIQIIGNKFVSCTTPIDVNDSDVVRPLITENTMYGCTNSGTYAGATGELFGNNLWHDGTYDNTAP